MTDIITRLLAGEEPDFNKRERGAFFLSPGRLEITADPGETGESAFTVSSADGGMMEGRVITDAPRLSILTPEFAGASEEIGFSYRTDGLRGGDRINAHFHVITDRGEESIAVTVSVRTPYPVIRDESGEEEIKNLFHFANLARRNFDEAVRLFYSPRLLQLFHGSDRKYYSVYRGLSGTDAHSEDRGHHVEEFLIAVRKKDPVEFVVDRLDVTLEQVTEDTEEILTLTRKGWGYTSLYLKADGDFITLRKDRLTDRDFLGNTCRLPVVVRYDRLHAGRNFGRLILENPYTRSEVFFTVTAGSERSVSRAADAIKKQELEYRLIRDYVDYRLGKSRSREWLIKTGETISAMNAIAPDDVRFQLYTAHYLITASRESEAVWVLDRVRVSVEETASYGEAMRAYFLYLETLLSREDKKISAVEDILEGMLLRNRDDWRIAWLLQFLFDDGASGNSRRMKLYAEQFEAGCRSPILYIETLDLMGRDPSILKKMDELSLFCLTFAARHDAIPKPLIDRIVWILMREKKGCGRYYKILDACYREDPDSGAVDAVCSLLIKDQRTDEEAFKWYGRGVKRDSRITRLYEYYMMSWPGLKEGEEAADMDIPRQVLLFFAYRSELPFDKNALLYCHVLSLREKDPELYQDYLPQMERFAAEQMAKGRIDRNLSVLYAHFCAIQPQDAVSAERFFEALHTVEYEIEDNRYRRVVVVYDRLRAERVFPVVDGRARVPVYSDEAAILLEDSRGLRYAGQTGKGGAVSDIRKRLKKPRKLVDAESYDRITPFLREGTANINLYLTEAGRMSVASDNIDRYRRLASSDALVTRVRTQITQALIRFYYDNDFVRQLADYLPASHPERMTVRDRGDALEMMVLSGIYEQAFDWIARFGFNGVDDRTLYRLCSRAIARGDFPEGENAVMIALAAFKTGKYDEGILKYLVREFTGSMKDEQTIYRACESFSVDELPLAERILSQLMYTGESADNEGKLFKDIVKGGGSDDLQKAFLALKSRRYILTDEHIDGFYIERIRTFALSGEELPVSVRLAYLKYFAGRRNLTPDSEVRDRFLRLLTDKESGLPFLSAYKDELPALSLTDGMRFVSYSATRGMAVTIWVKRGACYAARRMREPYPGLYTHGEILYPGESCPWYITVRSGDTDRLDASGTLSCELSEDIPEGGGRYAMTARLIKAKAQNDRRAVAETLRAIYKNEFLSEKLFPLPGE